MHLARPSAIIIDSKTREEDALLIKFFSKRKGKRLGYDGGEKATEGRGKRRKGDYMAYLVIGEGQKGGRIGVEERARDKGEIAEVVNKYILYHHLTLSLLQK